MNRFRLLAVALLFVGGSAARADLLFTLTPSALSGPAGSTVTFSGTLTNTGAAPLNLSGIIFNLFGDAAGNLSGNDTIFLNDVPLTLDADGGTYNGPIFAVDISSAATDGTYFGLATIQGGADLGNVTDLATANFQVDAFGTTTAPEPTTLCLLATVALPFLLRAMKTKPTSPE